jgi:hypothetical protein
MHTARGVASRAKSTLLALTHFWCWNDFIMLPTCLHLENIRKTFGCLRILICKAWERGHTSQLAICVWSPNVGDLRTLRHSSLSFLLPAVASWPVEKGNLRTVWPVPLHFCFTLTLAGPISRCR